MAYVDDFLSALRVRAGRRHRLDLDALWVAFTAACPHLRGRPTARGELRQLVDDLVAAGQLRLPRSPALFDEFQRPPLPHWVELIKPRVELDTRDAAREIAWHPALAFVPSLRCLAPPELAALRAIQRFLAEATDSTDPVTVRERSLQLFGDEKRLEALARGRLFGPGRLDLELLRARMVHPPFVFRDLGAGDTALVIENKDTFCSAVAAAASLGTATSVRWVVFGSGNAILQTWPSMLDWPQRPERALYFGDIDTDGLEILSQLMHAHESWPGLPAVTPCEPLYSCLANRAVGFDLRLTGRLCAPDRAVALAGLFASPLRDQVRAILQTGGRWPQEAVTEADFRRILCDLPDQRV